MVNKKFIFIIFIAIILIAGVFASYVFGNPKDSIQEKYSKGANIQGWINVSFQNEYANSIFSDSFGNSIELFDLLETSANSNLDYTCAPSNCQSFYTKTAPATQKQIILGAGEEKIIGFVLNDDMDSITNFSLTIISDAIKSNENQLKINLFNDLTNDVGNTKSYAQADEWSSPRDYSCFDSGEPQIKEGGIKSGDNICQRATLQEAPGFSLGAWIKKESPSDSLNLKMNLYDIDLGEDVASCDLPSATTQEDGVYCDVNYLVTKQKDYYVCLSAESGTGTYKIKTYGFANDRCGFKGFPGDEEIAAYKIFTQPRFFDAIGTLEILDELPAGDSISYSIGEYIENTYDNLSCGKRNCIVPIKLISNVQQTLTLSGEIEYDAPYITGLGEKNIYDLSEEPGKITLSAKRIYLNDANFTVPNSVGEHTFKLFLGNAELLTKKISVNKGVEILSINPVKTAAGFPTNFKVKTNANNITIAKYKWDFDNDGTIDETTLDNIAKHTYILTGNYNLIISVEDSEGTSSSESFSIDVGSAKDILPDLIIKKQEDLLNVQGEISNYDLFSGSTIENVLNLSGMESNLQKINSKYLLIKDSGTEQEFQELLVEFLEIELPKSISKTLDSAPLTFFPKKENIDLSVIETIAGGSYNADLEEKYLDALLTWDLNNAPAKISVKEYSANYDLGEEMLVKIFKLDIEDLGAQENFFVFANEMEGIGFKDDFSYDGENGYYSKEFTGGSIEFYTTEDINIEDLPVFISPSLEKLNIDSSSGATPGEAGNKFKWIMFILIIIFVIILGIAVYFVLKKWYKEKYETHLFKNKNDLYNMVTFIQSSKQHGKDNQTISKDLRKSGWSSEQVNYVMRKYSGKNTGMPGFAEKPSVKSKHI
ncbi:MAG: PKD domain-containing protein [Nanoarchaeota archaeon]